MQNSKTWLKIAILAVPGLLLTLPSAQAQQNRTKPKQTQGTFADSIAAVVNTEVITMRELNNRMTAMRISGNATGAREQVLQTLIDERLMNIHADELGITVTNQRLDEVLNTIARQNNLSVDGLKEEARRQKMNWDDYLADLRRQIKMEDLRSRVVQTRVSVTEYDIDAFLAQNPTGLYPDHKSKVAAVEPRTEKREVIERSFDPKAVAFQHIFVRVPDDSSPEAIEAARKKANEALAKIRRGQSFASVAKQYSDGPEAAAGGNLGIRMNEDWPSLFVSVSRRVRDGGTTSVFQAPNGFHILKVVERRGVINESRKVVTVRLPTPPPPQFTPRELAARQAGPVNVTESHVRHILVRITPVFSDQQAQERINRIYQRLQAGEQFADLAMRESQDASAPLGGDIGWITPGQADPAFEQAANHLQVGQVSAPVRSSFGWHIIEVLDRRTEDKQASIRRDLARETLFEEQASNVLQDWLMQLRSQSYIDNRLTGKKQH